MDHRNFYPVVIVILFVFLWEALVRIFSLPFYILPPPSEVFMTFYRNFGLLMHHTFVTLKEIVLGIILALILSFPLAILMFFKKSLERAFYPLLIASQAIPVFAIAPLLVYWFGYSIISKVIMATLIVFFPITLNLLQGIKDADQDLVDLLWIAGASKWQILWKVRFPWALPFIFAGLKIGVSVSTIGAIIGEWVGSTEGLGYLMLHANAQLRIALIFASLIILSVIGLLLFYGVELLERILIPWKRRQIEQKEESK